MTSNILFSSYVSLPTSCIKSPGVLLKDKKDPKEVKTNTKLVQNLFESVSTLLAQPQAIISHRTRGLGIISCNATEQNLILTDVLDGEKLTYRKQGYGILTTATEQNLFSTDALEILSPDETQVFDVNVAENYMLISKRAKKMLSIYEIELVTDVSEEYYDLACNVLKCLVSEICSFHRHFFKKIALNQLVISTSQNFDSSSFKKNVIIVDELLHGKTKIYEVFYHIIFHNLAISNPLLINDWKEIERQEETYLKRFKDFSVRIEESFVASFIGLNHGNACGSIKVKMGKLEDLLVQYYPEEMPRTWFCERSKEKRKVLKVNFHK